MDSKATSSTTHANEESVFSKLTTELKSDVIKETLKLRCVDPKTKITEEAVELVKTLSKALVVEAAMRSAKQARIEKTSTVTINHVENALLQLMLDFP